MFSLIPHIGDWLVDQIALGTVGAEKLDFLPDPPASYQGTMPFNQNYGPGTHRHFKRRAVIALPFVVTALLTHWIFSNILAQPAFKNKVAQSITSGQVEFNGETWKLPTQLQPFDLLATVFSPSVLAVDPMQRIQATSFLVDLGPLWLIFLLESARRANAFKPITLLILFGIAFQLFGIGVVGPIWFFLHYLQSPLADYAAKDWRLVNFSAARTAGLAVFSAFTIPTLAMYFLPEPAQRLKVNAIWQAFPILSIALYYLLRKTVVTDTTRHDRIYNVRADMPYMRLAVWILAAVSAMVFNWARLFSRTSLAEIFIPDWTLVRSTICSANGNLDLISGMRLFLQVDEIVCFAAAYLWLAYLIHDLKEAEMTAVSWWKVAASAAAGTYLIGPGAVVVLGWWWRENILATKNAKGSVGPRT